MVILPSQIALEEKSKFQLTPEQQNPLTPNPNGYTVGTKHSPLIMTEDFSWEKAMETYKKVYPTINH
jgi:hypothetical protein